ncbi:MAG: M20/M25/M40 family metallo-hydrolase [Bacteroidota bacterium]
MKRYSWVFLIFLLFTVKAAAQQVLPVTADQLRSWCYYLAGDDMKGRRNGTPEMKLAAEYIAASFRESGLVPAVGDSTYFQEYKIGRKNKVDIMERNVLGILEGSDPVLKDEWIVLSAHFDHTGIGKPVNGDSIYNGADDNATGTVTVMALAKLLTQEQNRPKRSILFAAFSGEEMGLRGSRAFIENPPIPKEKIRLNLNFEMTGECKTLGDKLFIMTGYKFTDLDDLVDEYNKTAEWKKAEQMKSPDGLFFASDNAAFAIKGSRGNWELNIPAFTLVTTDDLNIIHKVTDEPQLMDYENMASFVNYAAGLIRFLSGDPLKIHWNYSAFEEFTGN